MANHQKPSKEQLKANMNASLDQLNNLPPEGTPPVEPPTAPTEPPIPPVTPQTPPTGNEPPVVPPVEPPAAPQNETPEQKIARLEAEAAAFKKEAEDAKKKFSSSSSEAQVLGFKDKEISKAQEQADALPEPTDEEMKAIYPNWEEIDALTKDLAKDRVLNKKKTDLIAAARAKFKNVQDWNEKVETFVQDPAVLASHPELEGKQEAFKTFANKSTRRGVDFEDLILAFQGEEAKKPPVPKAGEMFPSGDSSSQTPPKPKDDTLSPAEGAALMKSDYKKYKQLLLARKIRFE